MALRSRLQHKQPRSLPQGPAGSDGIASGPSELGSAAVVSNPFGLPAEARQPAKRSRRMNLGLGLAPPAEAAEATLHHDPALVPASEPVDESQPAQQAVAASPVCNGQLIAADAQPALAPAAPAPAPASPRRSPRHAAAQLEAAPPLLSSFPPPPANAWTAVAAATGHRLAAPQGSRSPARRLRESLDRKLGKLGLPQPADSAAVAAASGATSSTEALTSTKSTEARKQTSAMQRRRALVAGGARMRLLDQELPWSVQLPIDLSLKTTVRITGYRPFSWLRSAKMERRAEGLAQFVRDQPLLLPRTNDDQEEAAKRLAAGLYQCACYYVYPTTPALKVGCRWQMLFQ